MSFKEKIKQKQSSKLPFDQAIYNWAYLLYTCFRFITNSRSRSEILTKRQYKNRYFQVSSYTKADRYPLLFGECKKYLAKIASPRILSFGCATGEEVFTLAQYFPGAYVYGVDINDWCIRKCRACNKNDKLIFLQRFSAEFDKTKEFDAIFCMAVFQDVANREGNNNVTTTITFENFEKEILNLDLKLKKSGLFIIDHSDFSFMDTSCGGHYRPLDFEGNKIIRKRPWYDRNNQKVSETCNNYRVFIKE